MHKVDIVMKMGPHWLGIILDQIFLCRFDVRLTDNNCGI